MNYAPETIFLVENFLFLVAIRVLLFIGCSSSDVQMTLACLC